MMIDHKIYKKKKTKQQDTEIALFSLLHCLRGARCIRILDYRDILQQNKLAQLCFQCNHIHFFLAATQFVVHGDDTFTEEAALITALQTGYVADVKPQTPTNVNIMYALMTIQDLV